MKLPLILLGFFAAIFLVSMAPETSQFFWQAISVAGIILAVACAVWFRRTV